MSKDILIIGAGASGMAAALRCSESGGRCICIDHNNIAGKKLAVTGNGRCNYTNTDVSVSHYHCGSIAFIESVLKKFSYEDCISFFRKIGIEESKVYYRFDDFGYIYPKDGGAAYFRDCLYKACIRIGVEFRFGMSGQNIGLKVSDKPKFSLSRDGWDDYPLFTSDIGDFHSVIIATGSNAYPKTGSDNSIYPLLMELGIKFNRFYPALCALFSKDERLKELKGKRIESTAKLCIDNREALSSYGEIQFNEHSISGIPVMQLSGSAAKALASGLECSLEIGELKFKIHRTAGFDRSQCCSGGIDLSEIDAGTMELKKIKGLYACGELLDIYGDCGGFNLHFAFASGVIAGKSAAKES